MVAIPGKERGISGRMVVIPGKERGISVWRVGITCEARDITDAGALPYGPL